MTPQRHALIKEIFLGAIGCPPEDRSAYVHRRCGDDMALRREVERLIEHHNDETISPDAAGAVAASDAWRREGPQADLEFRRVSPEVVRNLVKEGNDATTTGRSVQRLRSRRAFPAAEERIAS